MSELKISEAQYAKSKFCCSSSWSKNMETPQLTEEQMRWHLSELDRISGPLVEALRIADIALDVNESGAGERLAARKLISTMLEHYRKERGE